MSRSHKHNPILKDSGLSKFGKRQANRKFRRTFRNSSVDDFDAQHNGYRRHYEQWDIHDYVFLKTIRMACRDYKRRCQPEYYSGGFGGSFEYAVKLAELFKSEYPTVEDYLKKYWEKTYWRK